MSDHKPEVREVPQPALSAQQIGPAAVSAPAFDASSPAFQAAIAAAVAAALAKQAPVPVAPANSGAIEQLAAVLLARETRESEDARQKEIIKQTKAIQAGLNAQSTEQEKREKQRRCKHIKGGKLQKKGIKDWNVSSHTFVDGEEVIKCNSCVMRWRSRDTKEFLYRGEQVRTANGIQTVLRKYRNHTGIGWHEAKAMAEDSTNEPTRSEIVMVANPAAQQAAAVSEMYQNRKTNEIDEFGTPVEETVVARFGEKKAAVADEFSAPVEETVQK